MRATRREFLKAVSASAALLALPTGLRATRVDIPEDGGIEWELRSEPKFHAYQLVGSRRVGGRLYRVADLIDARDMTEARLDLYRRAGARALERAIARAA